MGKKCLISILSLFLISFLYSSANAQDASDVLRYSLQYPSYDPVSIVMPGVSDATGFGAYQENPASMGLFKEGFMSFGLSNRYINEEASYLGSTSSFDDNQTNIGDIGFVYKVPTTRGKLVIGGGYSQTHDFNRAYSGNAFNDLSTITDFYASLPVDDFLNEAAFQAFAINDLSGGGSISIFDYAENQFSGINQRFETTERGVMGEYSAFISSEIFKNLIAGVSIGVTNGSYKYEHNLLEIDSEGSYDGAVLDTDENGTGDTNIDQILNEDIIEQTFSGFSARVGIIYEIGSQVNFGISYQFKNTLNINQKTDTYITTTMDNNEEFSSDDLRETDFDVVRPARLNIGATAKDLAGFTISAMAERVAYSDGRIRFDDLDMRDFENEENRFVSSNYEDVINLRFGLEYMINDRFIPRIGFGYYPDPLGNFDEGNLNADRQIYSAGFTTRLSENTKFNLGGHLATWDDRSTIYSTPDVTEVVTEEVYHWNIMAGITIGF